jgi:hypothetical protein
LLPLPFRERDEVRFIASYAEWVVRGIHRKILNQPYAILRPTLIPRLLPEREKEPRPPDLLRFKLLHV